jgi:hypothetical protein
MTTTRCIAIVVLATCTALKSLALPDRPAPGEPSNTQINLIIPGKLPGFQNHVLEIALHEYDPHVKNKEIVFDKYIDKAFRHATGTDTVRNFTLGAARSTKPGMQYFVTVAIYDARGMRTHLGEKDGVRSLCSVLTVGKPNQVNMLVRPAKPQDNVMDIADEIRKGNDIKASALAKARAVDFADLYDVENLYRPRTRKGMGWGSTPNNVPIPAQDALENKLRNLSRAVPLGFFQDENNNLEAAYWIAALAELTKVRDSEFQAGGKKTKMDWHNRSAQLRFEAVGLASAIAARDEAAVKARAQAIINACDQCHIVYRD